MTLTPAAPLAPDPEARAARIAELSAAFAIAMPALDGPLVAFVEDAGTSDPSVCLAGDLHAVHPSAATRFPGSPYDRTLDEATITIERPRDPLELAAREGIWCTRLSGEGYAPETPFILRDSHHRIRTWLLLPGPRFLVGHGHHLLPAVRPL